MRRGFLGTRGSPTQHDLAARPHACGWYLQKYSTTGTDQQWEDLYFFTETEAQQGDFDVLNHYISTSKRSLFTKVRSRLCAIIAPMCAQLQHVQRIHL